MENLPLAEPGVQLSIWGLFWQAGWVVKLVMIGLLLASIWTWAIVVDKLIAYARMRGALNRFEQIFWSGQSLEELYRTLADRKTVGMGAIFVAAMREWKKSFEKGAKSPLGLQTRIDKAMDLALTREIGDRRRSAMCLRNCGACRARILRRLKSSRTAVSKLIVAELAPEGRTP